MRAVDPVQGLPTYYYEVYIPRIAVYNQQQLELFGLPVLEYNGKTRDNSHLDMELVTVTLNRLVEIHSDGFPIRLNDPSKLKELATHLYDYLNQPTGYVGRSRNLDNDRVDDHVEAVQAFYDEIMEHNELTIAKQEIMEPTGWDEGGFRVVQDQVRTTVNTPESVVNNRFSRYSEEIVGTQPVLDTSKIDTSLRFKF